MPGDIEPGGLVTLAEQSEHNADDDASECCQDGDRAVLALEEGHGAFENGIGHFLHGWGAGVFAQDEVREVACECYCEKPHDERHQNIQVVVHVRKRPP